MGVFWVVVLFVMNVPAVTSPSDAMAMAAAVWVEKGGVEWGGVVCW